MVQIPAHLITAIRKAKNQTLTQEALIEAETTTVDQYGAPTHTWETVADCVPCRVIYAGGQPGNESMSEIGNQEMLTEQYRIICPYGTALSVDQRVTVDGIVYDVVGLVTDLTQQTDTQAIMVRGRGEG